MELNEILKNHCTGKYVVSISIDDDTVNEFEFDNLLDAINCARNLTFEDCEKEKVKAEQEERIDGDVAKDVNRYNIHITMQEDYCRNDWVIYDDVVPAVCFFAVKKS